MCRAETYRGFIVDRADCQGNRGKWYGCEIGSAGMRYIRKDGCVEGGATDGVADTDGYFESREALRNAIRNYHNSRESQGGDE